MVPALDLRRRARAAAIHLILSIGVAVLAAALVFGLWYPGAFRNLSGGRDLFVLVTVVDVIIGPVLTFAVFDLRKSWPHLRRDLAIIGVMQLGALLYGLHTVYIARPVAIVFEADRFRVVSANDVHEPDIPSADAEYRRMPLTGPWLLSTRAIRPGDERNEALFLGIAGVDIGMRPNFWQPYEKSRDRVVKAGRPISLLFKRYPDAAATIRERLTSLGHDERRILFVPVIARGDWVALVRDDGTIVDYANVDGFFE